MLDLGDLAMAEHRACYGKMFPDVLHVQNDRPQRGKVFSVVLERAGGLWRSNRQVTAEMNEWDECRECPFFHDCYKFCMAKLALSSAVITE
jgi:radical SAM protein with 4Fe4S-binding SPASM domain